MSYFGMSYEDVLDNPMQRLFLLAKAIPKSKHSAKEKKKSGILDFVKNNNLLKKR